MDAGRRWGLQGTNMANHELDKHDGLTREDISDAYGDWHTDSEEGALTRAEMEEALRVAAQDIYRCTVAITTMFEEDEIAGASFDDLRPGTGVLVKSNGVHGIVTAAHVLGGVDKRRRYERCRCTIGILLLQPARPRAGEQVYFRIRRRRCLAYGVDNQEVAGPDIAYIPLTPREWALLEPDGGQGVDPPRGAGSWEAAEHEGAGSLRLLCRSEPQGDSENSGSAP